jgi:plasmid maintenance system antidote protein VapI
MPERDFRRNPYQFSVHIGGLCAKHQKNVQQLAPAIGVDPKDLLDMINGRKVPTKAVIQGLAKELDSDPKYLEKLAEEIRK